VDVAPLVVLAPEFAAGFTAGYFLQARDHYAFQSPQDSVALATRMGFATPASVLDEGTRATLAAPRVAVTYHTPGVEAASRSSKPSAALALSPGQRCIGSCCGRLESFSKQLGRVTEGGPHVRVRQHAASSARAGLARDDLDVAGWRSTGAPWDHQMMIGVHPDLRRWSDHERLAAPGVPLRHRRQRLSHAGPDLTADSLSTSSIHVGMRRAAPGHLQRRTQRDSSPPEPLWRVSGLDPTFERLRRRRDADRRQDARDRR